VILAGSARIYAAGLPGGQPGQSVLYLQVLRSGLQLVHRWVLAGKAYGGAHLPPLAHDVTPSDGAPAAVAGRSRVTRMRTVVVLVTP
jgi:hypothetical protein